MRDEKKALKYFSAIMRALNPPLIADPHSRSALRRATRTSPGPYMGIQEATMTRRQRLLREMFGVMTGGDLGSRVMQYQAISDQTLRRWVRAGLLRDDRGLVEITEQGRRVALYGDEGRR